MFLNKIKKTCNGFFAKIVFGFVFLVDLVLKNSKSKQLLHVLPYFVFLFPHFFEIWAVFCVRLFLCIIVCKCWFSYFLYVYVFLCMFFFNIGT